MHAVRRVSGGRRLPTTGPSPPWARSILPSTTRSVGGPLACTSPAPLYSRVAAACSEMHRESGGVRWRALRWAAGGRVDIAVGFAGATRRHVPPPLPSLPAPPVAVAGGAVAGFGRHRLSDRAGAPVQRGDRRPRHRQRRRRRRDRRTGVPRHRRSGTGQQRLPDGAARSAAQCGAVCGRVGLHDLPIAGAHRQRAAHRAADERGVRIAGAAARASCASGAAGHGAVRLDGHRGVPQRSAGASVLGGAIRAALVGCGGRRDEARQTARQSSARPHRPGRLHLLRVYGVGAAGHQCGVRGARPAVGQTVGGVSGVDGVPHRTDSGVRVALWQREGGRERRAAPLRHDGGRGARARPARLPAVAYNRVDGGGGGDGIAPAGRVVSVPARRAVCAARCGVGHSARRAGGHRGRQRLRQVHPRRAAVSGVRSHARLRAHSGGGCAAVGAGGRTPPSVRRAARCAAVERQRARQHHLRVGRCRCRRRAPGGGCAPGARPRFHRTRATAWIRHPRRRGRGVLVGRTAPAHRHRPRPVSRPVGAGAGRGVERAGHRERGVGAARSGGAVPE
eukprot:ctg_869.g281